MSLVYPRSVPGSSLLQNKRDSFETSFVDYLVIKHHSSTDGNPYSYIGNSGNYGGNSVLGGGAEAEGSLKNTIYLYLPPRLQEQYSTNYQRTTVGAAGVQALDAAGTAAAGGDVDVVSAIQTTAKAAKPQFVMDKIAAALGTINSALGASGSNLDANSVGALVKKKVFNPYQETTFRGTNYRSHNFTFQCQPRNKQESDELYKIINVLRKGMLPEMQDADKADQTGVTVDGQPSDTTLAEEAFSGSAAGRWLGIPDYFRLDIIRIAGTPSEDGSLELSGGSPKGLKRIMQFPTKVVLKNMNINLSPDGPYNSLKDAFDTNMDYGPASFTMSLGFDETAFLTRNSLTD